MLLIAAFAILYHFSFESFKCVALLPRRRLLLFPLLPNQALPDLLIIVLLSVRLSPFLVLIDITK